MLNTFNIMWVRWHSFASPLLGRWSFEQTRIAVLEVFTFWIIRGEVYRCRETRVWTGFEIFCAIVAPFIAYEMVTTYLMRIAEKRSELVNLIHRCMSLLHRHYDERCLVPIHSCTSHHCHNAKSSPVTWFQKHKPTWLLK